MSSDGTQRLPSICKRLQVKRQGARLRVDVDVGTILITVEFSHVDEVIGNLVGKRLVMCRNDERLVSLAKRSQKAE